MVARGKRTYWITETRTGLHQERAHLLGQAGYDVVFLNGLEALDHAVRESRPSTIILDTLGQAQDTARIAALLASAPELTPARVVLSVTRSDGNALKAAMMHNFRDIIPMTLSTEQWMQRIQYAIAPRPVDFPRPLCALTMNQVAMVQVSARLVWLSATHMRIECRGSQKPGSNLQITGDIATALGLPHVSLTVESVHKDRLIYRYSQAVVGRWRAPASHTAKVAQLLKQLDTQTNGPRTRLFIAMNRGTWRKEVVESLNPATFEINVALQRANIAHEFKYFSPDVVMFDDRVISALADEEIKTLFNSLAPDVPLVIFGADFGEARLRALMPGRPLFSEAQPNAEHLANTASRYAVAHHVQATGSESGGIFHITSDHAFSIIELQIAARLMQLNPSVGTIALPFQIGAFSLARLEAPLLRRALGRDPYIKITNAIESAYSVVNPQFAHSAEFYLADVDVEERKKLGQVLLGVVGEYYGKHFAALPASSQIATPVTVQQAPPLPVKQTISIPLPTYGNAALKAPPPLQDNQEPKRSSLAPELIESPIRRGTLQDEIEIDFDIRKYIDPVILKSIAIMVCASIAMGGFLYWISTQDYRNSDSGKEYSDFFVRMSESFKNQNKSQDPKK